MEQPRTAAPAAMVPTLPRADDTGAWEALARDRGRAGFQETELVGLSPELLKRMVTVIKQKRGDPLIGMHQYSTATVCIRYLCTHFETRRERENRLKSQKLTEAAAPPANAAVEEERAKRQAAERAVEEERAKRQAAETARTG